jgi:RimJ/RimL family protein N-acetyltransferase
MDAATVVLETPRLRLRTAALADAGFFLRLMNEPSWLENIGDRGVRSLADAAGYIANNIWAQHQLHGYGMYAVQLRSSGLPIGICGLVKRDFLPGPDLGVALLPDFVGQGYALEAARAVTTHAQSQLGIRQLYAIVGRSNHRSVRLLERLGFSHEERRSTPQGVEVELYLRQFQASA